jgi:D-cysteine desulfhydrase family pyridoxal phosphate-dependent enzyme
MILSKRDWALSALGSLPHICLAPNPSPLQELPRLGRALGAAPRLFVKRDDALAFACGGNKVRKMEMVAAAALAAGADTLVSCGGVQSNHARVTAAVAARLGLRCDLILNGACAEKPAGNHLLMRLFGANLIHVDSRSDRSPAMAAAADRLRAEGRRPYLIPIGASTALGAAGMMRGIAEILEQGVVPDVIIHASSSGGTQAGLLAGCDAFGVPAEVVGISVDEPAADIRSEVRTILEGLTSLIDNPAFAHAARARVQVDDRFVGEGYRVPTEQSLEAMDLAARTEGLILDPVYTAKSMAALIAYAREGRWTPDQTVVFWHTGGIPGLFA